MKGYREELKDFLSRKSFLVAILLTALLAYGFAAVNSTIYFDDLEASRYVGEGNNMLQAGRFGTVLWSIVCGYRDRLVENAFVIDVLSVGFLSLATVNFGILFRRISSNQISMSACTVFACVLLSYPLMNEIWEYTGTNILICGGFLLASFALLLVYECIHKQERKNIGNLLGASLLLTWVCASYESIVPVYIFFVCAVLALQIVYGEEKEKQLKEVVLQGLIYAAVLVVGLILRVIVHRLYLLIADMQSMTVGATIILWNTKPFADIFISFVKGTGMVVLQSIIYFPLTELLVAMVAILIIGICACRKHGAVLLLPGFGMYFSLVILSIIQGFASPYRTCQVYGAFVAFTAMILVVCIQQHQWKRVKWVRPAALVLAGYLCFFQAAYLNYFLTLNHLRSEEEASVIRQIGTDLEADFDLEKPVIFVGTYQLSDYIQEAASIPKNDWRWSLYCTAVVKTRALFGEDYPVDALTRKLPETNVRSVLQWGRRAFGQEGMQNLFAYYGFEYVLADYNAVFAQADEYTVQNSMPGYPVDGYIQDVGDYIIVNLGNE